MNNFQVFSALTHIVKNHNIKTFDVISADVLQKKLTDKNLSYPKIFIVNVLPSTAKENEMGHWVVVWRASQASSVEIFDSFGFSIISYGAKYWGFLCRYRVKQQRKSIQNVQSALCGQYCLYYIRNRLSGKSIYAVMSNFSADTLKNDEIVKDFYDKLKYKIISHAGCNQASCRKRDFICKYLIYCLK